MATPTDIVNIALRRIGADRVSSMENDSSKEARVARDIYDEARRDVLNHHAWNFAIRREQLTASATEPEFGWDYAYPLPDDFVRMVSVHPGEDDDATVPYKLEFQDGDDRVVLCNSNQVYIRYVFDNEDVNTWSASFRDVLAWRLARDFAAALSKSAAAAEGADRALTRALTRSKSIDGIEDWPEKMAEGDWTTIRSGYDPSWW
jgi:hypothetical protein